jgi:mycofactocin precursor
MQQDTWVWRRAVGQRRLSETEDPRGGRKVESSAREAENVTDEESSLIEEDLLVEEVSIDGMCGVY